MKKEKKKVPWWAIALIVIVVFITLKWLAMLIIFGALQIGEINPEVGFNIEVAVVLLLCVLAVAIYIGAFVFGNKYLESKKAERRLEERRLEVEETTKANDLPVHKKVRAVECPYCGAANRVFAGSTRKCDYCGQMIEAPKE